MLQHGVSSTDEAWVEGRPQRFEHSCLFLCWSIRLFSRASFRIGRCRALPLPSGRHTARLGDAHTPPFAACLPLLRAARSREHDPGRYPGSLFRSDEPSPADARPERCLCFRHALAYRMGREKLLAWRLQPKACNAIMEEGCARRPRENLSDGQYLIQDCTAVSNLQPFTAGQHVVLW